MARTTSPRRLSRELRTGKGRDLARRRAVAGLSLFSAACMGYISLYQMGLIRHLPDPPLPNFKADRVDASQEAYARFQMPDGFLGLMSYSLTAALAAAGGKERARRIPILPLALTAKATVDSVQAARLTLDQWKRHRTFCGWCLLAAGATFAAVPLTLGEAVKAVKAIKA